MKTNKKYKWQIRPVIILIQIIYHEYVAKRNPIAFLAWSL